MPRTPCGAAFAHLRAVAPNAQHSQPAVVSAVARLSAIFAVAAWTVACGGSTVSELSGPTAARCDTSLSGVPPVVGASGAQLQVNVVTSRDCVWNMSGGASWVQLSPRAGQGESTVTLVVAANGSTTSRVTSVTINERTVNIVQDAAPPPPPADPDPAPTPNTSPAPSPSPVPGAEPSPVPGPSPSPSPGPSPAPPTRVGSIELEGTIASLSGSCPTVSFSLRGRQVVTTPQTRFSDGNCRDLRNGVEVEVDGDLYTDGTVRATRIELDD
jgi:hypothetical protein